MRVRVEGNGSERLREMGVRDGGNGSEGWRKGSEGGGKWE